MLYEKPRMEILEFHTMDVICASVGDVYDGDDNSTGAGGSWIKP